MSKIDLSIIVPVYNVEAYIAECLNSLVNQNYQDYEIIVVDDGSPDGSMIIADDIAKKSDKIKIMHKENGGLSSARNFGLEHASGQYIWFVDSDDRIETDCLAQLVERMKKYDLDILSFNAYHCAKNGRKRLRRKKLNSGSMIFNGPEFWRFLITEKAYQLTGVETIAFEQGIP